jgi:hypothetical protein
LTPAATVRLQSEATPGEHTPGEHTMDKDRIIGAGKQIAGAAERVVGSAKDTLKR